MLLHIHTHIMHIMHSWLYDIFCISWFCIFCPMTYVSSCCSLYAWISKKNKSDQHWFTVQLIRSKICFLLLVVLPAGIEPLPSAKEVCCPASSATDPLRKLLSIIALFPSWGPSCCCSRTTTCYSLCSPLFYHKKHLESMLLLFASPTVSSLYCWLEQEAASPVWRTLESQTRLVLIHCAGKPWWAGTHPTKLCINQTESYTEYA